MNIMTIYETSMCCSTGLCGVGVDPELLRISTVLNSLHKSGITIERFNLSNTPMAFVTNAVINKLITDKGLDVLPVTLVNGNVVKTGAYPTKEEILKLLDLPENTLVHEKSTIKTLKFVQKPHSGCRCGAGNCS